MKKINDKNPHFNYTINDIPKWAEFEWINIEITNTLTALENLFSYQDENLKMVKNNLDQKIKIEEYINSPMSEYELEKHISLLFDIEKTITYEIYRAQQFSQILILFSIFESKLNLICNKIEDDFGGSLESIKSNSVILKYKKFLVEFIKHDFGETEKIFNNIYNQYEIRNIIAHQNGIARTKQYNNTKNIKTISFSEFKANYNLSIPDNNFTRELLLLIKKFFLELLKVLKLKTNEKLQQSKKTK